MQVDHTSRDLNGHADSLASLALAVAPELQRIISVSVQDLSSVGREINSEVCTNSPTTSWISPILAYLKNNDYRKNEKKRTGLGESPHDIGYLKMGTYIGSPTPGLTFDAFILIPSKTCFGRSTKGYVEGTLEDGH